MALGHVVTGLDIGTTKITTIIAEVDENENVSVIGKGQTPSRGIERGIVVNLEETVQSIVRSVDEAQHMADCTVKAVYAGIAGEHIRGINSRAAVTVGRTSNEISQEDVKRVIEHAQTITIPQDLTIIHVIPQEFVVDNQEHVREPVGLAGSRLEGEVHIVTGAATSVQNVERAVERAGLQVADIVLQPLASSMAVLTPDEQELGVAMLDVGGGTTDIAIFYRKSIRHTAVVGLGGINVTNDIASVLRTPMAEAEMLKKRYGCALLDLVPEDREIKPEAGLGGRQPEVISLRFLTEIIESRMEEVFEYAWREIKRTEYHDLLASGVVLTGGGAMIKGAVELAERVFGVPVKLGVPMGIGGLSEGVLTPMNATGIGLVLFGASQEVRTHHQYPSVAEAEEPEQARPRRLEGVRRWFKEFLSG